MKEISYEELNEMKKSRVLVDFYSDSCGPCKILAMVLEKSEPELDVKVCKLNVDEHYEVAQEYKIMNLPTVILFNEEQEQSRFTGVKQGKAIKAFVDGE